MSIDPGKKEQVQSSLEISKSPETVSLSDVKADNKKYPGVAEYLKDKDYMEGIEEDCPVLKNLCDTLKLLANDRFEGDKLVEAEAIVKKYFEDKKAQYKETHEGPETAEQKEKEQKLKSGLKYGKEYIRTVPGRGRYLFIVPEGFDGSVDMYFPGDTYSISKANRSKSLVQRAKEKWKTGKKSALMIIEGDPTCYKRNQAARYNKFNFGKFREHFKSTTDLKTSSFNFIGHSRGGSALSKFATEFKNNPKGITLSFLDANYNWSAMNHKHLATFVKNGGTLNIAFQTYSKYPGTKKDYHTKNPKTVKGKIIPALEDAGIHLTKTGNRWTSADGRVNIVDAGEAQHHQVAQRYVGEFMQHGSTGETQPMAPSRRTQYASAGEVVVGKPPEEVEEYGEKHLKGFVDSYKERQKDTAALEKFHNFADEADQKQDEASIRMAGLSPEENVNDPYAKHKVLAAEYITDEIRINGHAGFAIDFKGNETSEWEIGAGHILPPTVRAIRVYDASGNELFDYAERKVVDGKVGYYTSGGEYAHIHSGYQVETLEIRDKNDETVLASIKEENEAFETDAKKAVSKRYLKDFFQEKEQLLRVESGDVDLSLALKIDSAYFETKLGEMVAEMDGKDAEWFAKSKSGEITPELKEKFNEIFDVKFPKEDLNFIANIIRLREKSSKLDTLSMTRLLALRDMDLFKPSDLDTPGIRALKEKFKTGILTKKEIGQFAEADREEGGLGGVAIDDILLASKEVISDEEFVKDADDFGNAVILRASAMRAFRKAKAFAAVHESQLKVKKSHSTDSSEETYQTGGALSLDLITKDNKTDDDLLKQVMLNAGFVNGGVDSKHWEIYTDRWRRVSRKSGGKIYTKEVSPQAVDSVKDYERFVEDYAETAASDQELVSDSPEVDKAFSKFLIGKADAMRADPKMGKTRGRNNCQRNAGFLAEWTKKGLGAKDWYTNCPKQALDVSGTTRLRGKKMTSLKDSHFSGLKPGVMIFVARAHAYPSGKMTNDPKKKIPVLSGSRGKHWFTYLGMEGGKAILTDNHGTRRTVRQMASWVKDRTVMNVYDPYAKVRDRMVVADGQVALRKKA
jgi:hypothetical protein